MFVPICICALDPSLYKNVKHFRFILSLLLFLIHETKKNFFFFHFSHSFSMWGQSDPNDLKHLTYHSYRPVIIIFLHTFRTTKSSPDFLCVFR